MSRFAAWAIATLVLSVSPVLVADVRVPAIEPATSGGLAVVDRSLARLAGHRRLLVVGAHPDDEDNALLAYVGRGLGGEVAYLSLSRGEGGQNLIGPELGSELGVIRTGELMAARRLEGTRQFFTRASDFGYTRSLDETFGRWPRSELRRDALRVARRFKPQIIVSVFPASERAGHGQHRAAAEIAGDLWDLSASPATAPELAEEGLEPWQPQTLYRRAWGESEAAIGYWLDSLDPITGRSIAQIAAESRSMHRSQDMGREQRIGRYPAGLVWLAGGAGPEGDDIFAGVDTRLAAIAATVGDPEMRRRLAGILSDVERDARQLREALAPVRLGAAVEPLAAIARRLAEAERVAEAADAGDVLGLLGEKLDAVEAALVAAAGLVVEATCDREEIALGESAMVEMALWRAGDVEAVPLAAEVVSTAGWVVGDVEPRGRDDRTQLDRWQVEVSVPADGRPTQPYYLEAPPRGDLYDWTVTPVAVRGEPFEQGPLTAVFDVEIAGLPIRLVREVVYRYGDQAVGEIRRPVRAVPPLEISVTESLFLWPRARQQPAVLEVVLQSRTADAVEAAVDLEVPAGWSARGEREFVIDEPFGTVIRRFELLPDGVPAIGRTVVRASTRLGGGYTASASYPLVEYPHIVPRVVRREAVAALTVFDFEPPPARRIGYVRGASDRVPDVLRALGLPLSILGSEDLLTGELRDFDVIVVGSRAYETNPDLRRSNPRLLSYVRQGGTLVVQYQQYQFVDGGYAPVTFGIARPHGRVTDETAPVSVLAPDDVAFNAPNRIEPADWQGWTQERGLYFGAEWDAALRPLLSMGDEGREPELGSLLVGSLGEGTYVYTGLSFFRQLPAGVPGAIRLFANLLSLGTAD